MFQPYRCRQIVELLVASGTDVALKNDYGRTPIDHFEPRESALDDQVLRAPVQADSEDVGRTEDDEEHIDGESDTESDNGPYSDTYDSP
jgi:hypothetical protein